MTTVHQRLLYRASRSARQGMGERQRPPGDHTADYRPSQSKSHQRRL